MSTPATSHYISFNYISAYADASNRAPTQVIPITGVDAYADRFWAKVAKAGLDECWPWTGTRIRDSYGRLGLKVDGKVRTVLAHRVAYVLTHGPIPADLDVLHRCDNPPCCNGAHLWTGTHQDNMADRQAKGRSAGPRGESNPNFKLSEEQVADIRRSYVRGVTSQSEIAARYGIDQTTVSQIVNHRRRTSNPTFPTRQRNTVSFPAGRGDERGSRSAALSLGQAHLSAHRKEGR